MRQIVLSKTAAKKLEKLLEYLTKHFSKNVAQKFLGKLDARLEVVKSHPESFSKSQLKKGLHKCVISKQTSVFYKFDSSKIYVVTIFDTRQNPKKLKSQVK